MSDDDFVVIRTLRAHIVLLEKELAEYRQRSETQARALARLGMAIHTREDGPVYLPTPGETTHVN